MENVYGPEIHSKVNIHKVTIENKPEEAIIAKLSHEKGINILISLIKIANDLDKRGLHKEAYCLDDIMEKI